MNYLATNLINYVKCITTALKNADFILTGAGSGLSAASGILYDDSDTFTNWFPGYYERYGLRTITEAAFYPFRTREEYYAYWTRHIAAIRYTQPAGKPYLDLYRILNRKDYFILTTNTDGQFLKAGFPPEKLCTPQGDYAYFQCSRPCNDEVYHNEHMIKEILSHIHNSDFAIQTGYIPRCPQCGSPLIPNIRNHETFVEKPWMETYRKMPDLLKAQKGKNLLLLELGVGYNTPAMIRYPFELLALQRKNTELIRINLNDDTISLLSG
ncbi:MAG: hypothetical protein LBQ88_08660, partial [Treponema sp.]|nr:hypothetical protein [Treponema sp.]